MLLFCMAAHVCVCVCACTCVRVDCRGSHPEMLVVASVSTEDFLRAQIVTNLFTSCRLHHHDVGMHAGSVGLWHSVYMVSLVHCAISTSSHSLRDVYIYVLAWCVMVA